MKNDGKPSSPSEESHKVLFGRITQAGLLPIAVVQHDQSIVQQSFPRQEFSIFHYRDLEARRFAIESGNNGRCGFLPFV